MAVLQDAHARAGHIIARMQNRCVAAAFQSWAVAVATSKEVAARRTQMVHAAVTRSNATLLGQMFVVRLPLQQQCYRHALCANNSMCRGHAWVLMLQNQMIVSPWLADSIPVCCFFVVSHLRAFPCTYGHVNTCMIISTHKVGINFCIISPLQLPSASTYQVLFLLTVSVSMESADSAVSNTPDRCMILPAMGHQPLSQ